MGKYPEDSLEQALYNLACRYGADLFGIADLTAVREAIAAQGGTAMARYPRAISVAVFFPSAVIEELANGPTHTYLYYYKVVNTRLDDIALAITTFLQKRGYDAFPIPASQRTTPDKLAGIFSHRMAAQLAGLGWIGSNCSLISPEVGPRLRLATVLTDTPLTPDQPLASRCSLCGACAAACPAGAIKGVAFAPGQPLEERFAARLCDEYLSKVRSQFGKRVCGRCLQACPWGRKEGQRHGG